MLNAFLRTAAFEEIRESFLEAAQRQGVGLAVATNADFIASAKLRDLPEKVIFWDKDVRLAAFLEKRGLRLYNRARSIALCDDKALTFLALQGSPVPLPRTILCPMTFPGVGYADAAFLEQVAGELSLPFVIKEVYGSFGRQVYLARSLPEAAGILAKTGSVPLLFQEFVRESASRDVRVYVVRQRVCAAMLRESLNGDFRANAALGGRASAHSLSAEEEKIALDACSLLGLDFAGVDLLLGRDSPLLCEVNSNAHFKALKAVTGADPAGAILSMLREGDP